MLLYAITDRHQLAGTDKSAAVLEHIAVLARSGIDYIQLREKDLSSRDLERLAARCVQRVRAAGTPTKLLINARCDIAIASGADGVHLRSVSSGEISAADARAIFDRAGIVHPVIAVSCHSEQDVLRAEAEGADFAVFGPIFGKLNEPGVGLDALRQICARKPAPMPVFALGGVALENAEACVEAGAAGIAGIRLFSAPDLAGVVKRLRGES